MKIIKIAFLSILLTSCSMPMTSHEFIKSLGEGKDLVINSNYKTVKKRLDNIFIKCLSKTEVTTFTSGRRAEHKYTPKSQINNGAAIYSLQVIQSSSSVLGKSPKDGLFVFTGRVKKLKNKTLVTTWHLWGHGKHVETFEIWASGKSSKCDA